MIAPLTLPNLNQRVTALRRPPRHLEIAVDSFAGVGGWGVGEEAAIGWAIDVAINHDAYAIENHRINHPATRCYQSDVFEVDPREVEPGRVIGHMHLSPDCTHHSKARGAAPVSDGVRGLAWISLAWMHHRRPRVVTMENVEEFREWGPTRMQGGRRIADASRRRQTFEAFLLAMGPGMPADHPALDEACAVLAHLDVPRQALIDGLGYDVDHRILRACDYGAPTIRKRFYLVARCDGDPITWPEPTHGPATFNRRAGSTDRPSPRNDRQDRHPKTPAELRGVAKGGGSKTQNVYARRPSRHDRAVIDAPYRTAADCIDFSIPCPSIFLTREEAEQLYRETGIRVRRPLKPATQRRIANGVRRFVLEAAEPFIVRCAHGEFGRDGRRRRGHGEHSISEPLPTLTQTKDFALVEPTFADATTVAAFLAQYNGEAPHQDTRGQRLDAPLTTVASSSRHALVAVFLSKRRTGATGSDLREPMPTITAGHAQRLASGHTLALTAAFLQTYYGNSTTGHACDAPMPTVVGRDRIGLVTVAIEGRAHVLVDIGMRMLQPHELLRAQFGEFADGWVLTGTKAQQVAGIGNSVCPHVSRAIVGANYEPREAAPSNDRRTS